MSRLFEEIDRRPTPMGDISLRRRFHPGLEIDIYEVILGDEHLMSSLFTAAEIALADLSLAATEHESIDVVVGGLGLGYTAHAALTDARVSRVAVVDAMPAVIEWHQREFLPLSSALVGDDRCTLVLADFFAAVEHGEPFGPGEPERVHAFLIDIDHTPGHVLDASHRPFYTASGLRRLADRLHTGGVFGLWSDDPPDDSFLEILDDVFDSVAAHVVAFPNPHTGGEATNTVYVATVA